MNSYGTVGIAADLNGEEMECHGNDINIPVLNVCTYNLTVVAIPDANHISVNKTVTLTVNKSNSIVNVNDVQLDYGTSKNVDVATVGAVGIVAKIDNVNVSVANNAIAIPYLDAGTHILTVTTIPDANHNTVSKSVRITVNKIKTQLSAKTITATYNIDKNLVIALKDINGNPLGGVSITVDVDGARTLTTDNAGQVKVSTAGLEPKIYAVKITFGGDKTHVGSAKDVKITVKKATPKLTAKKKTFKAKTKTKSYAVTLKDNRGKAIKRAKVTLIVKGRTYKAKTNDNGKVTFKLNKLTKKGNYKATVKFAGNNCYNKVTIKAKITIR